MHRPTSMDRRNVPRRRRGWGRRLALVALFALAFVAAASVLPRIDLRPGPLPRAYTVPNFERPGDEYFFTFTTGDDLSQAVLYHDLGASIENARAADILFFGNSRLPLGLRGEFLVPRAEEQGLRVFSIACGHVERLDFALTLIERHDLRPEIMVVSGSPHLFIPGVSTMAQHAMAQTPWEARKQWLETRGAWSFQSRLHHRLPKLDYLGDPLLSKWIIYRSSRTGWWHPATEPKRRIPVSIGEKQRSYRQVLPLARTLHATLTERDTLLLFTIVPYDGTQTGHLPLLRRVLGSPFIRPSFAGLHLADGSHLDRESAQTYTNAFWQRFIRHPKVRQRLDR